MRLPKKVAGAERACGSSAGISIVEFMHKIFRTTGNLRLVKDASGKPVENDRELSVFVDAKYELQPSPHQPLVLDIYGNNLVGFGQCVEKLTLDNGVILTGRTRGRSMKMGTGELRKIRMFDVEERMLQLYPDRADSTASPEIDSVVFGIVSSDFLGSSGMARPGFPFSYVEGDWPESKSGVTWSTPAFRIAHDGFEMTFVETSGYWKNLVDEQSLQHDMTVGIRKLGGGIIDWKHVNELTDLLPNFLGWVNHCVSPVFHIKAYRKGRLVYRGYNLSPHATVQRDRISWLPFEQGEMHRSAVEHTFGAFSDVWKKNSDAKGTFHFALQFLRSKERGVLPRSKPSVLYLRDTFGAIGILTSILVGVNTGRGRYDTMVQCVEELKIPDRLPYDGERDELKVNHANLWWERNRKCVQDDERRNGTLCRPVANLINWLLHLDDPTNAERLNSLRAYQGYFVEVSIWLADLMLMKVVGHKGDYFNRLSRKTEKVPWES